MRRQESEQFAAGRLNENESGHETLNLYALIFRNAVESASDELISWWSPVVPSSATAAERKPRQPPPAPSGMSAPK
jgi:hypothetical protein